MALAFISHKRGTVLARCAYKVCDPLPPHLIVQVCDFQVIDEYTHSSHSLTPRSLRPSAPTFTQQTIHETTSSYRPVHSVNLP